MKLVQEGLSIMYNNTLIKSKWV